MARIPEAEARLFKDKFICKKCKTAMKVPVLKVLEGKVTCRKCKSRALRPARKK